MRERNAELLQKNIKVAVVTFEASSTARRYQNDTGLDWPLLVDESRQLYSAYGMMTAGFWDLWGFSTWQAYIKEIARGHRLKSSSGDIHQRGGDVLIDPDGMVRLHHISKGPADRPPVKVILQTVS